MATIIGLNDTVKLADPQKYPVVQKTGSCFVYKLIYSKFRAKIFKFSLPWQQGLVWHKCHMHSYIGRLHGACSAEVS